MADGSDVVILRGTLLGVAAQKMGNNLFIGTAALQKIMGAAGLTPFLKAGTPFKRLPSDVRIMGPKQLIRSSFEMVKSMQDGTPVLHATVEDLTDFVNKSWWISAHTMDPYHIIVDWDGETYLSAGHDPIIMRG